MLVYVLGEPVRTASTESLLIVGATALLASVDHARAGRKRWRTAIAFGLAGATGSLAGTALNQLASPQSILAGFALLLLIAAAAMIHGRGEPRRAELQPRGRSLLLRIGPVGLGTGLMTGFFGVGGGFAIVPALVLALPLSAAVGTSLVVIAITSATALAAHLSTGTINWMTAVIFITVALAGAITGSRAGARLSQQRLAQAFGAVVLAVAVFLTATSVHALIS